MKQRSFENLLKRLHGLTTEQIDVLVRTAQDMSAQCFYDGNRPEGQRRFLSSLRRCLKTKMGDHTHRDTTLPLHPVWQNFQRQGGQLNRPHTAARSVLPCASGYVVITDPWLRPPIGRPVGYQQRHCLALAVDHPSGFVAIH